MQAAVAALGAAPRPCFSPSGRLSAPGLRRRAAASLRRPHHRRAGAGFDAAAARPDHLRADRSAFDDELALMRREGIEILVTKNSGGRRPRPRSRPRGTLGLPVVMVRRPAGAGARKLMTSSALQWLDRSSAGPVAARRQHPGRLARAARDEAGLARADQHQRAMSATPGSAAPSVVSVMRSSGAAHCAGEGHRRRPRA